MELAGILRSIVIRVSDQGSLPVTRELAPGHSDEVSGMCDIEKSILRND